MALMESIDDIRRKIAYELERPGYPEGFPQLPDLPAERYVSREFYDLENKYLWPRCWLYAGHKDQFPEVGSWLAFDGVPGMPVIVVRGERGFNAFYNTCQHRGGCLVTGKNGTCAGKRLFCGYHAWSYDLEGNLIGVPDSRDFQGLDKSKRGLVKLRCETWGGWIFINASLDAPPLLDYVEPLIPHFAQYQPDQLALISSYSYDVKCNWKILMDAFAENYHFNAVHKGTTGLPGPKCAVEHRGTVLTLYRNGHSRNILPWNKGFEPRDCVSEETGFSMGMGGIPDIETVGPIPRSFITAFTCFPNLTTPMFANGIPVLVFWPTGINTSRMDVHWFGLPHGEKEVPQAWQEKITQFNFVLDEDLVFVPSVQTSAESPGFRSIVMSYQERRIYFAHEHIDRIIGAQNIPAHLRVRPVLEGMVEA
jgi:phenylpropionate dioxygenase-like ring-hydroxylating dioxygenase large terminal subunit